MLIIYKGKECFGAEDYDIFIEYRTDIILNGRRKCITASYPLSVVTEGAGDWPEIILPSEYDFTLSDNKELIALLKQMVDDGVPMLEIAMFGKIGNDTCGEFFKGMTHSYTGGPALWLTLDDVTKSIINNNSERLEYEVYDVEV